MMKSACNNKLIFWLSAFLIAGICLLHAVTPLPCYADNSTSVNVTFMQPEITGIESALEKTSNSITDFNNLFGQIFKWIAYTLSLILMLVIFGFALWQKNNVFLYVLTAGIALLVGGLGIDDMGVLAFCIIVFACYNLYEAVMKAFFGRKTEKKSGEG